LVQVSMSFGISGPTVDDSEMLFIPVRICLIEEVRRTHQLVSQTHPSDPRSSPRRSTMAVGGAWGVSCAAGA
jgi:hypothetical protein